MNGSVLKRSSLLYRVAALSNFVVTIPAFIAYDTYVGAFTDRPPDYPFLVWIWSGMAFLWGVMFWEIASDPLGRFDMIKYSYIEKGVTSISAIVAYATGDVPTRFLLGIVFTDIVWIPLFMYAHFRLARLRAER